jgi:hypothetical protein
VPLRQPLDPCAGVKVEPFSQAVGECVVPPGIKCPQIAQELANGHPIGKIAVLAQVADPTEHADWVEHRVAAEDAHRTRLGLQEAEHVFNECRLPRSILTDQPEHGPPRNLQVDPVDGQRPAEPARQPANL